MTIGIAIPAYRNAPRLAGCLDSILEHTPDLIDGTVVADDSGNGEVTNELKTRYPQVRWIAHNRNLGFGASANEAVLACPADVVILLNDDVRLLCNPCEKLRSVFSADKLFAVSFRSENREGKFREGAKRLIWRAGFPKILHNPKDQLKHTDVEQASSYAVGGHCAYRREYFEKLGGFDRLFEPFYWEDADLSVRASAEGLGILYSPECRVLHEETGAIKSSHKADEIRKLTLRNRILFAQRHCPGSCRLPLKLSLAMQRFQATLINDTALIEAFEEAVARQREMSGPMD